MMTALLVARALVLIIGIAFLILMYLEWNRTH